MIDDELTCHPKSLAYDFETREGKLYMAQGDSCNVSACIVLFRRIDPEVGRIETFSGERRATCYCRDKRGKWVSLF
jgi:hypothetical protein